MKVRSPPGGNVKVVGRRNFCELYAAAALSPNPLSSNWYEYLGRRDNQLMQNDSSPRCAAKGCCEPPNTEATEFCYSHVRLLLEFMAWLENRKTIAWGRAMSFKPKDARCSFDVARTEWAKHRDPKRV
jgi:hypothetical protein